MQHLAPGGVLLIYDYFQGDLRETKRLKRQEDYVKLDIGNAFLRQGENTNAIYFNQKFIDLLKEKFQVEEALTHDKQEHNKKTGESWLKRYLLVKIRKE